MFKDAYKFYGSHVSKVEALTAVFEEASKIKMFNRVVDVYVNAPLIGFLYNRKADRDISEGATKKDKTIFLQQILDASIDLKYIFRLIILLDKEYEPDEQKRIDKAFRHLGKDEKDLELFDKYVRGGVDVLYEKLIEDADTPMDYIQKLYEFVEEIDERFNDGISTQTILNKCRDFSAKNK